jgi:hypothetical protein
LYSCLAWESPYYSSDPLLQRINAVDETTVGNGVGVFGSSMGTLSYQKIYRQTVAKSSSSSVVATDEGGTGDLIEKVTFPVIYALINVEHGDVKVLSVTFL